MGRLRAQGYNSVWFLIGAFVVISGLCATGEMGRAALNAFALTREGLLRGELWRLITYPFIATLDLWFVFKILVYFYIAAPLEATWGTRRFLTLFGVSVIVGGLTAAAFNVPLIGDAAVFMTLMLIHGFLFPENVIYLFFILPVRIKTLAIIATAIFLMHCLTKGLVGLAYFAGMLSGVVYYMATTRSIPWVRRARRRIVERALNPEAAARRTTTERLMDRARTIIKSHQDGHRLSDEDRDYIEALIQRSDPSHDLCSPYSFSPDNTICPPCSEFGRCLRRYLESEEQDAGKPT